MKRIDVLKKEIELEKLGRFDEHIDPIAFDLCIPITEKFPYIKKPLKLKIKYWFLEHFIVRPYSFYQNRFVMHTKVYGRENLKGIKSGIVTCNHLYMFDCLCAKKALKNHKLNITTGWFNNINSKLGEYMRADGIMPIPDDIHVIPHFNEAVKYRLDKGGLVMFYPEQSEWWMYEKPRPYKNGAFHYAAKHNVPIIPLEICLKNTGKKNKEGLDIKQFNIYILKPIYPLKDLSGNKQMEYLRDTTFQKVVEKYESFYKRKLSYDTDIDKTDF